MGPLSLHGARVSSPGSAERTSRRGSPLRRPRAPLRAAPCRIRARAGTPRTPRRSHRERRASRRATRRGRSRSRMRIAAGRTAGSAATATSTGASSGPETSPLTDPSDADSSTAGDVSATSESAQAPARAPTTTKTASIRDMDVSFGGSGHDSRASRSGRRGLIVGRDDHPGDRVEQQPRPAEEPDGQGL